MEKLKGFDYSIEVESKDDDNMANWIGYAEVILVLTNYKSSVEDTVLYIKTIEGTNIIHVVSMIDLDSLFKRYDCRIISKDETQVLRLDSSDLKSNVVNEIEYHSNKDIEYYVELDKHDINF